ncbi:hypothetical protein HOD29_03630 [archaeon]|jgi:hypothetical protein|nr:hypothetical protein [archaeon]
MVEKKSIKKMLQHSKIKGTPSGETKKKTTAPKTKKEKVTEIFEVEKKGKEKVIQKTGTTETPISTPQQNKNQERILKNILIISGAIILLIIIGYFYAQSQINFNYKGISFEAVQIGEGDDSIIFYETRTLLDSIDGDPFGFRLRTKPSNLKKIPFDDLESFQLMKYNAYSYGEGTFNCNGDGVIAMPNFQRLFQKMGMGLIHDQEATCDPGGRYNYFNLEYGNETEIKMVGKNCYDVVIKGNDDSCEILPATEKLMVELFVKYSEI